MATMTKFTLADSGQPIHLNADLIEQVRMTVEDNLTAIYLNGKNSPIIVSEKVDVVVKRLQSAGEAPAAKPTLVTPAAKPEAKPAAKPKLVKPAGKSKA